MTGENPSPSSNEMLLGHGLFDGVMWTLVLRPEFPHGPAVFLSYGDGGGGSTFSEQLDEPFGVVCLGEGVSDEEGLYFLHGQIQEGFVNVTALVQDGPSVETTLVDSSSHFGFNWYVAILRSWPVGVMAEGYSGERAFRKWS
jgi:hypothetical protein